MASKSHILAPSLIFDYSFFIVFHMVSGMPIIFEFYKNFGILQLKVEVIKLFDLIIRDLNVTIGQSMKVLSLLNYIQKWILEL
jgi:hypothetical protein